MEFLVQLGQFFMFDRPFFQSNIFPILVQSGSPRQSVFQSALSPLVALLRASKRFCTLRCFKSVRINSRAITCHIFHEKYSYNEIWWVIARILYSFMYVLRWWNFFISKSKSLIWPKCACNRRFPNASKAKTQSSRIATLAFLAETRKRRSSTIDVQHKRG